MKNISQILPQASLRAGLALTYIYSGIGMIREPDEWSWFIPAWMKDIIGNITSLENFLLVQGTGEILLGLALLSWFLHLKIVRLAAGLGTLHVALILLFVGIDTITFRDIGLLGAWIALTFMTHAKVSEQA